jgi:hypothetical protein
MRTHRTFIEKVLYSDVFRCPACNNSVVRSRLLLGVHPRFLFSRYSHCVRCGTPNVHRSAKRDYIDSVTGGFLGRVQHVLGAPVNKCLACRLQYYDWRPPRTRDEKDSAS